MPRTLGERQLPHLRRGRPSQVALVRTLAAALSARCRAGGEAAARAAAANVQGSYDAAATLNSRGAPGRADAGS